MDEGGHGLVTLVKHTIPSEAAEQVDLGDGTETLSTRIWINNKPLLLHNLYRVDGDLDITTPLTREPRSIMVGDFNARDERWCRANNRAGSLLNEQIQDLDNFCLMNHPQVWTTVNKTVIDLSIVPVDMALLTSWSIYPGLLSDHLAVLLEIQPQNTPGRVAVPMRWRTQHADWELYREHMMASRANIEWTDVDTNEVNSDPRGGRIGYTQVIGENISSAVLEEQHGNQDGQEQLQFQTEGIQTSYIAGQSGADASCIQRVYRTVYPCEEPILEPVDHRV